MHFENPVTIALIGANILVFLLIHLGILHTDTLASSYLETIHHKQYYRIITSAFTQEAYLHLAMNVLSLYNMGDDLEPILGPSLYLICYGIFVLVGGTISVLVKKHSRPNVPSIGASGAICGLFGLFIVILYTVYGMSGHATIVSVLPTLILIGLMTFSKNIDSISHFVGLFVGIITGIFLTFFKILT